MIQGSSAPLYRGTEPDGFDFICANCGHVIVENTIVGELWNLVFRCFACGTFNASPFLPPGTPLPIPSVMVPPGNYMIGGTVDGKRGVVMVGQSAVEQRSRETGWMTPPGPATTLDNAEAVRGLVERIRALIGPALFRDLETSDLLARRAKKTPAKHRHRLMEIVEAAEKAERSFRAGRPTIDPVAVVELQSLIEVLSRWRYDPAWRGIVASLRGDFHHALMTLAVASFFMDAGNGVGLHVEEDPGRRAADIRIAVGSRERISIEVKTPLALRNPQSPITDENAARLLRKALKKASTGEGGQLDAEYPGILAVGGFHLRKADLDVLERLAQIVIAERAEHRNHLAAIAVISVGALVSTPPATPQVEFAGIFTTRYVRNSTYTGSVRIEIGEREGINRLRKVDQPTFEWTLPGLED